MTTLTNLGLDLYIRWILLLATNEPSVWQKDTDNEALSLWQAHANKVLNPFFSGREIDGETTFFWDLEFPRHQGRPSHRTDKPASRHSR